MTFLDKVKQETWHFLYKFFPTVQQDFLKWGIVHHHAEKDKYHIGWLAKGKTLEDLKLHLHTKWGFGNHFVAWMDPGQVLSWRKLVDFQHQYHLRVFEDGEFYGHYEFTPEAHPIKHLECKGEIEANTDFFKFLGDFVTSEKTLSHLVFDPNTFNPDSEITINTKMV